MRDMQRIIPMLLAVVFSASGWGAQVVEAGEVLAVVLKTPRPVVYLVQRADLAKRWVDGCERDRPNVRVQFSSRVVLQLAKGTPLGQAPMPVRWCRAPAGSQTPWRRYPGCPS